MLDSPCGRAALAALLLALAGASACQRTGTDPAATSPVAVDLLEEFPYTSSGEQAPRLNLGKPGGEVSLLSGWSRREVLPSGESVVRGIQRRAALQFAVGEPVERRLTVHCALLSPRPPRPPQVMVRLNQRWLESIFPQDGFKDFEVVLPAEAQHRGRNRLEFSHRTLPRRAPADGRRLDTVAYEWMTIERTDGRADAPFLAWNGATAEALVMPAPSQVDYFLRLPAAADLMFEIATPGAARAHLAVTLQRESEPERSVWNAPSASTARIDLGAYAGALARLSLKAEGEGTLRLTRPRLVTRDVGRSTQPPRARDTPIPSNVVLYIADTLRADHVGCYGAARPTSPHIDAFANDAVLFSSVVAQSSWTRPATASILTGLFPYSHGAVKVTDGLRPDATTLAQVLQTQGYETAAYITNVNVSEPFGFRRGFQSFTYLPEEEKRPSIHVLSDALNSAIFPWLEGPHTHPFFLYVHATDAHAPYTPPADLAERFRPPTCPLTGVSQPLRRLMNDPALQTAENISYVASLYDAEIAFLDANFGKFIDELKRLGLYDHTIIVFTADHGEEFHDHGGFEHGRTLYRELLHVPLIMRVPSAPQRGARIPGLVRQVDIMPTVLDTLGIPIPAAVQGTTLRSPAGLRPAAHEAFAQTGLGGGVEVTALVGDTWKVIQKRTADKQLFDVFSLDTDPGESENAASEKPILLGYARQVMQHWTIGVAPHDEYSSVAAKEQIDSATAERLRILGYTQ